MKTFAALLLVAVAGCAAPEPSPVLERRIQAWKDLAAEDEDALIPQSRPVAFPPQEKK